MPRRAPMVAAIHDLSGVGRCALTVAIPVISAMGVQVCPAITAALSAHTGFPDIETVDLTGFLARELAAWGRMGLEFDGIYTGYLGSPAQARMICEFMDTQNRAIKLIDPVMGDDGRLYSGIDASMASAMAEMCRRATLITPNMTEYACLSGEEYSLRPRSAGEIEKMLNRLDAESAVITSVPIENGLANACRDSSGRIDVLPFTPIDRHYPGTGDLFSSVLCGRLVLGDNLRCAVERAARHVAMTIAASAEIDADVNFGVQLEKTLPLLMNDAGNSAD